MMTDEEKALAREQAKKWLAPVTTPGKKAPKRWRPTPSQKRALPPCIYLGRYVGGTLFYRVQWQSQRVARHVGCYLTLEEAVRRLHLSRPPRPAAPVNPRRRPVGSRVGP
jgi:hypothetical protein